MDTLRLAFSDEIPVNISNSESGVIKYLEVKPFLSIFVLTHVVISRFYIYLIFLQWNNLLSLIPILLLLLSLPSIIHAIGIMGLFK